MAGVSLGGMTSGLDTQSIIDQLMAIERAPEARLKLRESGLQARQSALTDVASRLRNLLTAARTLGSVTTWTDTQTLDVSDSSKISATRLSGAAPGGHTIEVTTLARAEQRSYSVGPGGGTLDIGGQPITLTADDDGQDAADKINAATGSPYYAVWVKDPLGGTDDRLVLTRKQTGLTGVPPLNVSGTNLTQVGTTQPGADAEFIVDGVQPPQKSNSNVVTSAIPGLQLTLKATGTTSVTVSPPGPDNTAVKDKVQAFVDQYNSTVDFIRGKLTEKRVPNATTDSDARKGALFADTQLTGLLASLRNLVSEKTGVSGELKSFADIGVSTGGATGKSSADAIAGKLTLDAAKLTEALQNHRTDAKGLLTDTTNGLSAKLANLLEPVARASSGLVDQRASQTGREITSIDGQISKIEDRLADKAERLKLQFAAMEQALANSRSQGSWLSAQLG